MGGNLIPIVVYWDGDGFSLAKHILVFKIKQGTSVEAAAPYFLKEEVEFS